MRDASDLSNNIDDDINQRIDESRDALSVTLWIVVPASVVGLLIMVGLMRSFYAWVFNPIRDLEAGVSRVARRRLHATASRSAAATRWKTWRPPSTT